VETHANAIDLSGGGMLVKGLEHARLGDVLRFALELGDGQDPVRGQGKVVRQEAADRVGLQFCALEQPDRIRLMHLAFEMSREQRRRFA
jgi:c-di-GMP-binding flagellar brake protein YcgR